jgi:hypothetical protein
LLFAGSLVLEMEPLETRYYDYELGYALRLGKVIYKDKFWEYTQIQMGELQLLMELLIHIYSDEVRAVAFGPSGVAGDPSRILHLAKRYVSIYDEFLLWVERVRGTAVPSEFSRLTQIMAKFADQPIREIRRFVEEFANASEQVPEAVATDTPLTLEHQVTFNIPNEVTEEYHREIERLKSSIQGWG